MFELIVIAIERGFQVKVFVFLIDTKGKVIFRGELKQMFIQVSINITVELKLIFLDLLDLATKFLLRDIFIQKLVKLLHCNQLFLCQDSQESVYFLIFFLLV